MLPDTPGLSRSKQNESCQSPTCVLCKVMLKFYLIGCVKEFRDALAQGPHQEGAEAPRARAGAQQASQPQETAQVAHGPSAKHAMHHTQHVLPAKNALQHAQHTTHNSLPHPASAAQPKPQTRLKVPCPAAATAPAAAAQLRPAQTHSALARVVARPGSAAATRVEQRPLPQQWGPHPTQQAWQLPQWPHYSGIQAAAPDLAAAGASTGC